ncbi:flagellar protein FliS [Ligilactobacillus salitolerans]|uniref:Flagellar secretion chaperone FliS n=1 Tax=Ligilactobacillus salitolerans TaxID=1808352 RepID=A0A401IVY5_9LACO|nr:flagellar export chaperone FliS [Ligilactobacillus salitolerans]GBG95713.1 flagellar protein FliS [Ligilactobacillus salitolerans]
MDAARQAQKQQEFYLKNQVLTASANKLISLLLSGAIKAVKLAGMAIEQNHFEQANYQLVKAQDIIDELRFSLDHSVDAQLTANLDKLYDFMNQQLMEANLGKDQTKLPSVVNLLQELLETWEQVGQN